MIWYPEKNTDFSISNPFTTCMEHRNAYETSIVKLTKSPPTFHRRLPVPPLFSDISFSLHIDAPIGVIACLYQLS